MEPSVVVYPSLVESARTIVMLHGLGNSMLPFSEFLSQSSGANPDTAVIAVTYGVSFEAFSDLADKLWVVLQSLHFTRNLVLFGYSMGGFIAQVFAKRYPHAVIGMVLACTGCAIHGSIPLTIKGRILELLTSFHRLDAKAPSLLPKNWFLTNDEVFLLENNKHVDKCLSVERNAQMHAVLAYMADSKHTSITQAMEPLQHIPVLILHGTEDSVLTFSGACAMHRELKNSVMRVFKDAGHGILMRFPEQVADAVHAWLQTLPKPATVPTSARTPAPAPVSYLPVSGSSFSFAYVPFAIQGKQTESASAPA